MWNISRKHKEVRTIWLNRLEPGFTYEKCTVYPGSMTSEPYRLDAAQNTFLSCLFKTAVKLYTPPKQMKDCTFQDQLFVSVESAAMLDTWLSMQDYVAQITNLDCSELDDLVSLPKEITALKSLRHLFLGQCKNLETLPPEISHLSALSKIELQGCQKLVELPEGINQLSNMSEINLNGCIALQRLPAQIGQLKYLQSLSLANCRLIEALPDDIYRCKSLLFLTLDDCTGLKSLPEGLLELPKLMQLDIKNCPALYGGKNAEIIKALRAKNILVQTQ